MLVWGMICFQSPVVCLKTANQLFTGLPKYVLQFTHCSTHVEPTYNRITSPCFTPILALLLLLYIPLLNIIDITAIMFSLIITYHYYCYHHICYQCSDVYIVQRSVAYCTVRYCSCSCSCSWSPTDRQPWHFAALVRFSCFGGHLRTGCTSSQCVQQARAQAMVRQQNS